MRVQPFQTLKHYNKKNLPKDILAGIIIMAVSIPISMGYAQIAGFRQFTDCMVGVPDHSIRIVFHVAAFIFGVDAAPAALVGSAIVGLGIESGTKEAMAAVPVLTFFVALWLLAFYFMKAGKLVNFIFCTGHGRIYHRNLYHDHTDAGAKADGWNGRSRRTF